MALSRLLLDCYHLEPGVINYELESFVHLELGDFWKLWEIDEDPVFFVSVFSMIDLDHPSSIINIPYRPAEPTGFILEADGRIWTPADDKFRSLIVFYREVFYLFGLEVFQLYFGSWIIIWVVYAVDCTPIIVFNKGF